MAQASIVVFFHRLLASELRTDVAPNSFDPPVALCHIANLMLTAVKCRSIARFQVRFYLTFMIPAFFRRIRRLRPDHEIVVGHPCRSVCPSSCLCSFCSCREQWLAVNMIASPSPVTSSVPFVCVSSYVSRCCGCSRTSSSPRGMTHVVRRTRLDSHSPDLCRVALNNVI